MTTDLLKNCDITILEKQSKGNWRQSVRAKYLPTIKINVSIICILFRLTEEIPEQTATRVKNGRLGEWN